MNPETNRFEPLSEESAETPCRKAQKVQRAIADLKQAQAKLLRPDGTEVPEHWTTFKLGEHVVIRDYAFRVAYIGETAILFEPVGPALVSGTGSSG